MGTLGTEIFRTHKIDTDEIPKYELCSQQNSNVDAHYQKINKILSDCFRRENFWTGARHKASIINQFHTRNHKPR